MAQINCLNCKHFTSYEENYEDYLEPNYEGRCDIGHLDYCNEYTSCNSFESSDHTIEDTNEKEET